MAKNRAQKNSDLELLRSLPVSKGKIMIAAILVTVMGVMWCRLLLSKKGGKQGPATAGAATIDGVNTATVAKTGGRISYVELPVVEGRNDVLTRDIFTTANWQAFKHVAGAVARPGGSDNGAESQILTDADIAKVENLVEVNAIIAGDSAAAPEAFVNNKLVSVGSKVVVEYNNRLLKLVVTEIKKNKVSLRWQKFRFNVKMAAAD